jgi:hypothetical protein
MHLPEKKVIYGVLMLTVVFFISLMTLPFGHHANPFGPKCPARFHIFIGVSVADAIPPVWGCA